MAYYYIKSGGTATGDAGRATTLRTGSFTAMGASAYYADISSALGATTAPVEGDHFLISSANTEVITTVSVSGVHLVSVSDSNANHALAGATIGTSTFINIDPSNNGIATSYDGIDFNSGSGSIFLRPVAATQYLTNCEIDGSGNVTSLINMDQNGFTHIKDTKITTRNGNTCVVKTGGHSVVTLDNVDFSAMTSTVSFCDIDGGGISLYIKNTDLSVFQQLFYDNPLASGSIYAEVSRCKLASGFAPFFTTPATDRAVISITECTNPNIPDDDAYHYFYYYTPFGEVEEDIATYLDATYDGTNGFSFAFSTSALCGPTQFLRYPIGSFPAQDLTTAKTVTVELTGDANLDDSDVWIEVELNDNTNEALGVVQTTRSANKLVGNNLSTAGTGTWTLGDTQDYIITKDLGAQTNVDNGNVVVYACVGRPSIDVNFNIASIGNT